MTPIVEPAGPTGPQPNATVTAIYGRTSVVQLDINMQHATVELGGVPAAIGSPFFTVGARVYVGLAY